MPLVLVCFFVSGATALILESLWTRMLTLVFGATSLAHSTVLATFMGGLALGSLIGGRFADRVRSPLFAYGLCEGAIGLYALGLPWLLELYPKLARALTGVEGSFWALSAGRFALCALALIVPTTLMGATLPLLARHTIRLPGQMGGAAVGVARLFVANTFGAVAGTFAVTFLLLPSFGLSRTHSGAALVNLALMGGVLLLARRPPPFDPLAEMDVPDFAHEPLSKDVRRIAIAAYAASGAAALVNQILWTRALTMVIGSSIYSFTLVLLAFLLGLAVGAAALGRIATSTSRPLLWLAAVNLGIALASVWAYLVLDDLPDLFLGLLAGSSREPSAILAMQLLLAMVAVLPATALMGATLPLAMRAASTRCDRIGRDVGGAYAANTMGAIVGALLGGFVLLPVLGIRFGLAAATGANLAIAALLGFAALPGRRLRFAALAIPLALAAGTATLPAWDLLRLSAGNFRVSVARERLREGAGGEAPTLVYYKDGLTTTVSVEKWEGEHFALKNNGKVDASSGDDMPTQIMVGLLPVLLHPEHGKRPLSVLVIGYASGVTVGAVLQAGVGRVDVVELEGATLEASRFFDPFNHRPLEDPRVRLIVDDGRNWLSSRPERYDVIVSEPSNPWITGVSNLFTADYFRLARERLHPGGVFCAWAQLYEMAPARIKAIYRAFAEEFPNGSAFAAEDVSSDTFLIGTTGPLRIELEALERSFALPRVRAELDRAAVRSPHDLVAFLLAGPDDLAAFTVGVSPNTDDNLLIELRAPLDLYASRPSFVADVYAGDWPYGRLEGLRGWDREPGAAQRRAALAESLVRYGRVREARRFIELAGKGQQADRVRKLLDLLTRESDDLPDVPLAGADGLDPPRPPPGLDAAAQARFAEGALALDRRTAERDYLGALDILEGWPDRYIEEPGDDLILLHGVLLYRAGRYRKASVRLGLLVRDEQTVRRRPAVLYYYGAAAYSRGAYRKGTDAMLRWLKLDGSGTFDR